MPDNRSGLPGKGFLGWLGRQVGHVAKAVHTDVTRPAPTAVLYRTNQVEQVPHPTQPGIVLRRTIVDEVVVQPPGERLAD